MADISASMVMELRQRTGLGMMECKKVLAESGGDLAKAEDLLRIRSGAKASKAAATSSRRSSRPARNSSRWRTTLRRRKAIPSRLRAWITADTTGKELER